jgi:S-(hydroxymethyl)glutathione dehydrogenase/alcohol dehydrogenase
MKGQGIDAETPVYKWRGQRLNAGYVTTFNEYAVVSENRTTPVPKDFDLKTAALFGCAVTTGFGVINNNAKVRIGESVVVFGVGGIGLSVVQGAAMVSAYPIIAVDIFHNKLELAKKLGATHVVNSQDKGLKEQILKIVGQSGADVAIDNTGNTKVIELAYELTHPQGRTVLVGVPKNGENINIYSLPLHFGKNLTGSHGGQSDPSIDIPRYVRLCHEGKMNLGDLITDTCKLADINIAIESIRKGEVSGRCVIEMIS